MRVISCIVLTISILSTAGSGQTSKRADCAKDKMPFADNWAMPKGGIGVINEGLYIVLNSSKNELLLKSPIKDQPLLKAEQTWTGKDVARPEVVAVFEGTVWSPQNLPAHFDLSKAVVVSFERDKVRFVDFSQMTGAYYWRPRKE